MFWQAFMFKNGVAGKVFAGVAASGMMVGVGTFTLTEFLTGRFWIALVVSGVCSVLVAAIRVKPQTIAASSDALEKLALRLERQHAEQIERSDKYHHEQVVFLHTRVEQQNKLISLQVITKHAILNEAAAMSFALQERAALLRQNRIEFEDYRPRSLRELTEQEDKARAEIVGLELPFLESEPLK